MLGKISKKNNKAVRIARACRCVCSILNPGSEDTGISRDELLIEEAVIEVFKEVRGD